MFVEYDSGFWHDNCMVLCVSARGPVSSQAEGIAFHLSSLSPYVGMSKVSRPSPSADHQNQGHVETSGS